MKQSKSKFCVLGATSFGGRSVTESLLADGHSVLGVGRRDLPLEPFEINSQKLENLEWVKADIVLETNRLIERVNAFKPEFIIDFMGQGMVAESWNAPYQWYHTNLSKKSEFISKITWENFLRIYIRISTPEVFGSVEDLITEEHSFNPSTPYALSHSSIDQHLELYANQTNFPFIISRYSNFYGPGQQLYRIIPKALYLGINGGKLTLDGGGISERSFIYKEDIASSINSIVSKGKVGETYHFTDSNCTSIKHLIKKVSSVCDIDFENFTIEGKERFGKDQRYFMSSQKVNNLLNWHPKTSLDDGIKKTLSWVRKIKHLIKPEFLQYHHIYRDYNEPNY